MLPDDEPSAVRVDPGHQGEIVWEFMNPPGEAGRRSNAVYRAYRLPYAWIPQLPAPRELPIMPPAPGTFHVPGTPTD